MVSSKVRYIFFNFIFIKKHCPCKPGSVPLPLVRDWRLSFIYYARRHASLAFYPPSHCSGGRPSVDGIHELAASSGNSPTITRRLVVSYTHLLTLTTLLKTGSAGGGGRSLLPSPAVANCFYFQKWSVLCCPDFPLAPPCERRQRQTVTVPSSVQR